MYETSSGQLFLIYAEHMLLEEWQVSVSEQGCSRLSSPLPAWFLLKNSVFVRAPSSMPPDPQFIFPPGSQFSCSVLVLFKARG